MTVGIQQAGLRHPEVAFWAFGYRVHLLQGQVAEAPSRDAKQPVLVVEGVPVFIRIALHSTMSSKSGKEALRSSLMSVILLKPVL